jgi:lipopolysaccharide cholinephosphotransferase
MKRYIENDELRSIELSILNHIDSLCRSNNLRYYLAGGTLLGAIRHKGFIPWDDDIDILMPRNDYNLFVELIKNQSSDLPYALYSYENNKEYRYTFSKLVDKRTMSIEHEDLQTYGVSVDIFILDGLGDDVKRAKRISKTIDKLRPLFSLSCGNMISNSNSILRSIVRFPVWGICKVIGSDNFNGTINKLANKNNFDTSDLVGCITGGVYGEREILPSSVFSETIDLPFENSVFKAPIGYHDYLLSLYGEYMELPPVEQQIPKHQIKAWWIEEKEE